MKSKQRKFLSKIFKAYRAGKLDEKSTSIIDRWFNAATPEAQHTPASSSDLREELFADIIAKTSAKKKTNFTALAQWSVAASILLIAVGFLLYSNFFAQHAPPEIAFDSFVTAKGEIKEITLSDGTTVLLNAGTTLRAAKNLKTSTKRLLILESGEAFFKVKRDTLRPFSISSGEFTTTVLGTSFNINFYAESRRYQVSVKTGKVRVEKTHKGKISVLAAGLIPGESVSYDLENHKARISKSISHSVFNWKTDRSMYFDQADLSQIAAELSRQYNLSVKVSPGGEKRKYSFQLAHLPIEEALLEIARQTGISYEQTNDMITLNAKQ